MASAGEVEQFAFCAHNWWLARQGVQGAEHASQKGVAAQERLARAIQEAQRLRQNGERGLRMSFVLVGLCLLLTVACLGALFAARTETVLLAAIVTLAVLNVAAGALTLGLWAIQRAAKVQLSAGLLPEGIGADADVVRDPVWGLSGNLQYVLHVGRRAVPMLFKTGKTPESPYRSHVLHLLALLRLVEVREGHAPEYGLLSYPKGVFRVPWDAAGQGQLRGALHEMAARAAAGASPRDHGEPRRCRGCARRESCAERLA